MYLDDREVSMKLLVCMKQVPDLESRFIPDTAGTWYNENNLVWRINEYDEFALEQAVQLKEKTGESTELIVLSIGPDRVLEALKKALALGCDTAVHIRDEQVTGKDPWQIATLISSYAGDKGFDVIFTGMQSQDRGSAQTGVFIAEQLGYACTTTLIGFDYDNGIITAKRELEGGIKACVRLRTPALVTCQLGLNSPRYPTLPNIIKAKKKEIISIPAADLCGALPMTDTVSFHGPTPKNHGVILEGDPAGMADQLIGLLREQTGIFI